jgi:hypothetical protein
MRRRRLARALAAGVVVPLVLLGVSACGDDDAKSGDAATQGAPDRDQDQVDSSESPDSQLTGDEVDPDDFGNRLAAAYDGVKSASMEMSIDASGQTMDATGVVDYSGDDPAMSMEMNGATFGAGTVKVILVDRTMYMQMPGQGRKYLEVALDDPNSPLAGSFGSMESFDPRATIESFTKSLDSVREIGEEDVNGTNATHYVVTADTTDIAGDLGADAGQLPDKLTYDIWLDGQDRPVQMEIDLEDQGKVSVQMSDYDEPVTIKAPPSSQVQKMPGS